MIDIHNKVKIFPLSQSTIGDTTKGSLILEENIASIAKNIADKPNFFIIRPNVTVTNVPAIQISSGIFYIQGYRFQILNDQAFSLTSLGIDTSQTLTDISPLFIYFEANMGNEIILQDSSITQQLQGNTDGEEDEQIEGDNYTSYLGLSLNASEELPLDTKYILNLGILCYSAEAGWCFIPNSSALRFSANNILIENSIGNKVAFEDWLQDRDNGFILDDGEV